MIATKTPETSYSREAIYTPVTTKPSKKNNKSMTYAIAEAGVIIAGLYAIGMLLEAVYRFICSC